MTSSCNLVVDRLLTGDCIEGMRRLPDSCIDLAFADPPFNIGYDYDIYDDRRDAEAYINWTRDWSREVVRLLKPSGTFWLAIGDEFAAEMKLLLHAELGLSLRSWVIWYYTFGVHCTKKFARSHAHLFYFVKDPKRFTFNDKPIRVPSARQLVYSDSRANPEGRLPDDTWFLRPQDIPSGFGADGDTWYFPRVCGTFKERAGWHGCQMPERLLARIIEACSNPGDVVLDPFAGSGTTLVVAKKLGRRYLGFELSPEYAAQVRRRLDGVYKGHVLEGSSPHASGKVTPTKSRHSQNDFTKSSMTPEDLKRGVFAAFLATRDGFPADRVVADPDLNERFVEMCTRLGLSESPTTWNRLLMNLRKAGKLAEIAQSRRTIFSQEDIDKYSFACEIALEELTEYYKLSLDGILCDRKIALEFDRRVFSIAHPDILPTLTSLKIRWAALRMRKRHSAVKQCAAQLTRISQLPTGGDRATIATCRDIPAEPGIYLLQALGRPLYVGETRSLRQRVDLQLNSYKFDFWNNPRDRIEVIFERVPPGEPLKFFGEANQSLLIARLNPIGNYKKLAVNLP